MTLQDARPLDIIHAPPFVSTLCKWRVVRRNGQGTVAMYAGNSLSVKQYSADKYILIPRDSPEWGSAAKELVTCYAKYLDHLESDRYTSPTKVRLVRATIEVVTKELSQPRNERSENMIYEDVRQAPEAPRDTDQIIDHRTYIFGEDIRDISVPTAMRLFDRIEGMRVRYAEVNQRVPSMKIAAVLDDLAKAERLIAEALDGKR